MIKWQKHCIIIAFPVFKKTQLIASWCFRHSAFFRPILYRKPEMGSGPPLKDIWNGGLAFGFEIGSLKENLNILGFFFYKQFLFSLLCVSPLVGKAGQRGAYNLSSLSSWTCAPASEPRWFCGCLTRKGMALFPSPSPPDPSGMAPCGVQRSLSCLL